VGITIKCRWVNAKHDAWQQNILSRFGVKLGNAMKELHAPILKAHDDLEHQPIEGLMGGARRSCVVLLAQAVLLILSGSLHSFSLLVVSSTTTTMHGEYLLHILQDFVMKTCTYSNGRT